MIKTITREDLRAWNACYADEQIAALVPPEGLTPLAIAEKEDVPVLDRLWVLLREEVIPARKLRLLACKWARRACEEAEWVDPRSLRAIDVAERYACGEATKEELVKAAYAAADAARRSRAAYVAYAAVAYAATYAAYAVDYAADERARQLREVVECLRSL